MSMKTMASEGDPNSSNRHFVVWIYPDDTSDIPVCEGAVFEGDDSQSNNDGVKGLCDELHSKGIVESYEIKRYTGTKPNIDPVSRENFRNEWDNWFENDSGYDDKVGCHLGVSRDFGGGLADSVDDPSIPSAFVGTRTAVAGARSSDDYTSQIAVHEILHTIVNRGLDDVDEMIDNFSDHDLGDLTQIGQEEGAASPLLNGYGSEHWASGDCSTNGIMTTEEHWTTMNNCEESAAEFTADHDY